MTEFYTPTQNHSDLEVYHTTDDPDECARLQECTTLAKRSESYVEWHDLSPCAYCGQPS